MPVISVVTRIFPLNGQSEDTSYLLKPHEIGRPIEVHKCNAVDPRTGEKFLLETTFCIAKAKDLESLKIPGLVPLTGLDSAHNNSNGEDFASKFAFSVPKNIPLLKLPQKVQNILKSNDLENNPKPSIKLHLNLKMIREATKKKQLFKKKEKLIRPLFKYFIDNECLICGSILNESRKSKIRAHLLCHLKLGTYACQNCKNECFSSAETLYNHSIKHSEKLNYNCSICGSKFNRKYFLKVHLEQKHRNVLSKQSSHLISSFVCSICKVKLTSWKMLLDHRNTHFGKESYYCLYCNKTFAASCILLRYHAHIQLVPNYYKCKHCKKTFSSRHKVKDHERMHRVESQHTCSFCGKKFNFKCNLLKHVHLHIQN